MGATDSNGVVRFSARNPHPVLVVTKENGMIIDQIGWKWDESIQELVSYVKGQVNLQAVTESYKDSTGVKNILAMVAQGDFSGLRDRPNLGDITGFPDNIHDAKAAINAGEKAAAALDGLKIKDSDGQLVNGKKLSEKENEEIQKLVQSYLEGLTAQEGANKDGQHE